MDFIAGMVLGVIFIAAIWAIRNFDWENID